MSVKEILWEEVNNDIGNWWKPETPGDMVQGVVIDRYTSSFGESVLLEQPDNTMIGLPSHSVLLKRLANIPVGTMVRITFTGTEKSVEGRTYNTYKLERARVVD